MNIFEKRKSLRKIHQELESRREISRFRSPRLTLSRLADGRGTEERWFTRRQLHRANGA